MGYQESSKIIAYVASKGWDFRTNDTQIILEECPVCHDTGYHFYASYEPDKDGVWSCFKCSAKGNMYDLLALMGDRMANVTSLRDVGTSQRKSAPIPDIEAAHRALLDEAATDIDFPAIEYLLGRGFTQEVIDEYKIGLVTEYGKRWIVYPYLHNDNPVYVKFRTIPPDEKDFRGLQGRECPLFNQDTIKRGMPELILCEGEADTLACLSKGITAVVGIPGANIKKASWIKMLDEMQPQIIYILYDRDKVGQAAAQEMAARIGIEKVRNILLPEFKYMDGEVEKDGKDINEFFRSGRTVEDFEALKAEAKPFDVEGIQSVSEIVEEIRDILKDGGSLEPKWKASPWDSLNRFVRGYDKGDLIGILAEAKRGKTTFALNLLDFFNVTYDEPVLLFCQEMPPQRLVRKWISMATDTDDREINLATMDTALGISADRRADYLFGYTRSAKRQDVFDTIRQAVRRYGVKFVAFDNLQMLCRSQDNVAQETSATTKEFKALAMELGIVIFLIMQPSAMRDGEVINSRKVYGSSAPKNDVDVMMCLHRNQAAGSVKESDLVEMGFMEVEEAFSPEIFIRVDLSRYSAGGSTTLLFDGAKSRVKEMTSDQIEHRKSSLASTNISNVVHPQMFEAA